MWGARRLWGGGLSSDDEGTEMSGLFCPGLRKPTLQTSDTLTGLGAALLRVDINY